MNLLIHTKSWDYDVNGEGARKGAVIASKLSLINLFLVICSN